MRKNLLKQVVMVLFLMAAAPCVNAQVAHVGDILCEGNLIVSPANYNANTHIPIGVVFYVDQSGQHGWAIALQDAGSFGWRGDASYSYENDTPLLNYANQRQALYDLDGYGNTQIVRACGTDYDYPAFYAVDFDNGWYVPTIGQFNYLYGNLKEVNESLSLVGGEVFSSGGWEYWSSSESFSFLAWYITSSGDLGNSGNHSSVYHYDYNKHIHRSVRAARNF